MTKVKVVVFDFDNCIALNETTGEGSEEIKDQAWFEVFAEYAPETLAPVLKAAQLAIAAGIGDRQDIAKDTTHGRYYLPNWNGLLGIYPGVFGGKIAYTDSAGYSTIVMAERNGIRLAALLTGAKSILERDLAAAALLDAGYIANKIKPVNLTKYPLNLRYQAWGDLARQIRGELAAGGQ